MRRPTLAALLMLGLVAPAAAQSADTGPVTRAEIRELIEAAQATAKASRENVEYSRVVPDLLFQILAKLDKIEDKLDKVENTIKADKNAAQKKR
ncbi:hypothetical protein [Microvirga sp. 17 mud 1-3]|uniref:hypothetical protein n=1 Tax=Microvirga sp. 17 mud 1-3 TaxID=2082949 RepID=UPI000D6D69AE|nr:hypothetical protein [Microvirga sp. 17 mud 1-3]AWM86593.1 hypothetical protein C4E04_07530 [Microvirga sp. 17 mud 1-3]